MKFFYLEKSDVTIGVEDAHPRILPIAIMQGKQSVDDVSTRLFDAFYNGELTIVRKRKGDINPIGYKID